MLTIRIQIRNVFGEEKAYPMNEEANCIARIAQTKTLTRVTLMNVLAMGATIEEVDRHGRLSRSYAGYRLDNLPRVA